MNVYISLLRGINVSGQKKIKMPELKALYESWGLDNVATYIQSGNVIFKSSEVPAALIKLIESGIEDELAYEVRVLLRTVDEFEGVIAENPFPDTDLSKLHVTFLAEAPKAVPHEKITTAKSEVEQYEVRNTHVYVLCHDGYGRTKLNNNFFEKQLRVAATTRNWNSVIKLLALAREAE